MIKVQKHPEGHYEIVGGIDHLSSYLELANSVVVVDADSGQALVAYQEGGQLCLVEEEAYRAVERETTSLFARLGVGPGN